MTGVYVIRNRITGKRYVGESVDIKRRWREHKRDLANGTHHSKRLQKDYNRYGRFAFSYRVRERFWFTKGVNEDKLKIALLMREGYWIDRYNSNYQYNQEDSMGDLKKVADMGRGNPKFAKYRKYRKFIKRHMAYATRWRPHIMVAGLYNPMVKITMGVILICLIYVIYFYSQDLSGYASSFVAAFKEKILALT